MDQELQITHLDKVRILKCIKALRHTAEKNKYSEFVQKIENATLIDSMKVPDDLVTMNSRVVIEDLNSGNQRTIVIVYPKYAEKDVENISILSPLGIALFGSIVGQELEYKSTKESSNRLRVLQILYQPELAGHYLI